MFTVKTVRRTAIVAFSTASLFGTTIGVSASEAAHRDGGGKWAGAKAAHRDGGGMWAGAKHTSPKMRAPAVCRTRRGC